MNLPNPYTFILFKKKPSFIDGVAAILDMSALEKRYNISKSEKEADTKALTADWLAIGIDMQHAINDYAGKTKQSA